MMNAYKLMRGHEIDDKQKSSKINVEVCDPRIEFIRINPSFVEQTSRKRRYRKIEGGEKIICC